MFTLGATAQEFSICLRCQSRLSLKRLPRSSRRRPVGDSARPRAFTSGIGQRQADADVALGDESPTPRSQIRYHPAHHDTHSAFRPPPKRPLGMESLGQPAEVLVISQNSRATQKMGDVTTMEPSKKLPSVLEGSPEALLRGIDATKGIADDEHIFTNIDSVRREFLDNQTRKGQLLSREEYEDLLSKLSNGFQKRHLIGYFQRSRAGIVINALHLAFPYSSTLFARTKWYNGTLSNEERIFAPPLERVNGENSKKRMLSFTSKGKHWHARNIIQNCWGLQNPPDGEIGRMAVRLQPTHLKLLLGHASNPLKSLSQTYSVKLEVNKRQSLVFVEADLSTSEDVLRMLLQILNRIISVPVLLDPESSNGSKTYLDEDYVEAIEGLTGTVIRQGRGTQINDGTIRYIVHYLGPEESDLEDVRRLLNNEASARMTHTKGDIWIKVPVDSTTSAIPKEFGESIPLIFRTTQWARFVDERGRRFDSEAKRTPLPTAQHLDDFSYSDLAVSEVHRFLSHRGKSQRFHVKDANVHWEPNLTRWSQVVLGQVAFPLHQAQKMETKLKNAKTNADLALSGVHKSISTLERVFATTLPGMTRALEAANLSLHPVERLVIRMVPSSTLGLSPKVANFIPELEILVRVNLKDRAIQLQTARLVLVHEEQDLLLPSQATDLRLMRRDYLYCNQREIGEHDQQPSDPCLTAFIEESQLDVWGSQRLRTPNYLHLSIPASSIPASGGHGPPLEGNNILVKYNFASIEHRSFVSLAPIGLYTPEYNTIQAGRTGGRREELAIRLGRQINIDRPWDIRRDTAKGLLEAALQVARSMR